MPFMLPYTFNPWSADIKNRGHRGCSLPSSYGPPPLTLHLQKLWHFSSIFPPDCCEHRRRCPPLSCASPTRQQAPCLFCMTVPCAQCDVACLGSLFVHSTLSITRNGGGWMITTKLLREGNWVSDWMGWKLGEQNKKKKTSVCLF